MVDGVVIELDWGTASFGFWARARLRKIRTPSKATNTTAQKINIPRAEGGGRFGNWITGENTTVHGGRKFNLERERLPLPLTLGLN